MNNYLQSMLREFQMRLDVVSGKRVFMDPGEIVRDRERILADIEQQMVHRMREKTSRCRNSLLSVPDISRTMEAILQNYRHRFGVALNALEQLSPLAVMKRGYGIPTDRGGDIIRSVKKVKTGDQVNLQLADGMLHCEIESIDKGGILGKKEN
jgi:exonuclease VII large subunit